MRKDMALLSVNLGLQRADGLKKSFPKAPAFLFPGMVIFSGDLRCFPESHDQGNR